MESDDTQRLQDAINEDDVTGGEWVISDYVLVPVGRRIQDADIRGQEWLRPTADGVLIGSADGRNWRTKTWRYDGSPV